MKDLMGMMGKLKDMQSKMQNMQAEIAELEAEGVAGGGMVKVMLAGKGDMTALTIDYFYTSNTLILCLMC